MEAAVRRRGKGEQHIRLYRWLLRSPAWGALSPNGKAVLLHVWSRHNGINNGQIVYGVRCAGEIGVSKDQAARALAELIELGFLKIRRDSSFTLKIKETRVWQITAEPVDGRPATKEFMSWNGLSKNISRSHQRDTRSHQRDRDIKKEQKNDVTVAPARPSEAKSTPSRSHQCDTSNIPGWYGDNGDDDGQGVTIGWSRIVRFGDEAKAQRTARTARRTLH
jgi:hypothetical protein